MLNERWRKKLTSLRSADLHLINKALQSYDLGHKSREHKAPRLYFIKCMVTHCSTFRVERRNSCKNDCQSKQCSLTRLIFKLLEAAKLVDMHDLLRHPKATDQMVRILNEKYLRYLNIYCKAGKS
jgi:hypothetical protein